MDYHFRQILLPPFVANRFAGIGQTCKVRRRRYLGQAKVRFLGAIGVPLSRELCAGTAERALFALKTRAGSLIVAVRPSDTASVGAIGFARGSSLRGHPRRPKQGSLRNARGKTAGRRRRRKAAPAD